eukprot:6473999-Amphidinium_carterae.1
MDEDEVCRMVLTSSEVRTLDLFQAISWDEIRVYIYMQKPAEILTFWTIKQVRIYIYIPLEQVRIYTCNTSGYTSTRGDQ